MSGTSRFGDLHTKTYDIELLISGALVFGLLTMPGVMEDAFDRWSSRLDGLASTAATYFFVYGQMVVYAMLLTFVVHLGLRGYWIALLGLESVWSDGWTSDRLKYGPYTRALAEQHVDTLSTAINKADDRASVVFAAGTILVLAFLYSLVMVVVAVGVATLIGTFTNVPSRTAFLIIFSLVFLPSVLVPMVDRRFGRSIDPQTPAGRAFGRVARFTFLLSPLRLVGPVQFVFQSQLGERRLSIAMVLAAAVLIGVFGVSLALRAGALRVDGWRYFDARPEAASIDPRHYRDSGVERDGRSPTIDSDIISGPLIRLYLPYRPRRHNVVIEKACPDLAAAVAQGRAPDNARGAACVGAVYTIALDGAALTPTFSFTRDAESAFVGILAYLPTSGLSPGPHELTIDAPRNAQEDSPREIVRIPFQSVR